MLNECRINLFSLNGTKCQPGIARRLVWVFVFFKFSSASSPGYGETSSYNNPELLYVRTVGASQWCGSCPKQRESVRVVQYRLTRKGHYVSYQGKWEPLYIPECYPIQTVPHINCITQLVTKLSDIVEQQTTTSLLLGVDCAQCLRSSLLTWFKWNLINTASNKGI